MNMFQLRIHYPQSPHEPIPVQEEFISYLQWPRGMPFYSEDMGGDVSSSERGNVHSEIDVEEEDT